MCCLRRQRLHRQRQHLLVEVPNEVGPAYMGSDYVGEIRRPIKATLCCGGVHRFTNGNRQTCRNYIARTEMRSARPIWSSHVIDSAGPVSETGADTPPPRDVFVI